MQDPGSVVLESQDRALPWSADDPAGHDGLLRSQELLTERGRLRRPQEGSLWEHEPVLLPRRDVTGAWHYSKSTGQEVTTVVRDLRRQGLSRTRGAHGHASRPRDGNPGRAPSGLSPGERHDGDVLDRPMVVGVQGDGGKQTTLPAAE